MKVLILGASGMLGHIIFKKFSKKYKTIGTIRKTLDTSNITYDFNTDSIVENCDVTNLQATKNLIHQIKPNLIINCVGVVKQIKESSNPLISIAINSLWPHQLAHICKQIGAKCIHFSTDCVFSGKKGNYSEEHVSDAYDLYGRSKYLGELNYKHCITFRTSIIGKELCSKNGLLEWFLSQKNKTIKGFKNAIFSGFTTNEVANILFHIIDNHYDLCGIYHLSSTPISKHDLLHLVKDKFGWVGNIEPEHQVSCNRSLDSAKLKSLINYNFPTWENMINDLK
ncbi:SDR family oxidoreductase [Verrucomicrobia bacterium]|nr:SDR family oxidoreductase [Verrucomicrobiota bacterium]